jgi:phage FluMu gp28-like protein
VYEQTFWDEGKQEEILSYMIRFPSRVSKSRHCPAGRPTCAACRVTW